MLVGHGRNGACRWTACIGNENVRDAEIFLRFADPPGEVFWIRDIDAIGSSVSPKLFKRKKITRAEDEGLQLMSRVEES